MISSMSSWGVSDGPDGLMYRQGLFFRRWDEVVVEDLWLE